MAGEYEMTLLELGRASGDGKSSRRSGVLAYRQAGGVRVNPGRPLIEDLDSLPGRFGTGSPWRSTTIIRAGSVALRPDVVRPGLSVPVYFLGAWPQLM